MWAWLSPASQTALTAGQQLTGLQLPELSRLQISVELQGSCNGGTPLLCTAVGAFCVISVAAALASMAGG